MRVLFTVAYLDGFHGSVIHVKEWGQFFVSKGYDVTIAAISWTSDIYNTFKKNELTVLSVFDEKLKKGKFDIIIAYHFPTIGVLLKNKVTCKKLILGSLSGMEYLESFPHFWNSASNLIVMSENTKLKHNKEYGIPLNKMDVIENLIPDSYFKLKLSRKNPNKPKNIAVVSNHIPEEIQMIKNRIPGVKVTFIGLGCEIYQEMTPELLSSYDVVISIGKTVQYAMGLGIPVYEYDRFGGCGYITPQNFENECIANFSGRATNRKLPTSEIIKEILDNYNEAFKNKEILKEKSKEKFLLSKRLDSMLEKLKNCPDFDSSKINKTEFVPILEFNHNEAHCGWTGALKSENYYLKEQLSGFTDFSKKTDRIDIFYDTGNGFSEEQKYVFNSFPVEVSIPNIKSLRLDPANTPCFLKINKIMANNTPLNFQTNAAFIWNDIYFFDTNDPNINIEVNSKLSDYSFDLDISFINQYTLQIFKSLNEKSAEFINQINNQANELSNKENLINQLQNTLQENNNKINEQTIIIDNQNNELKITNDEKAKLITESELLKENNKNQADLILQQKDIIETQTLNIKKQEESISLQNNTIQNLNSEIDSQISNINNLNSTIEKLNATITSNNESIQELQQNISKNNVTISELTNSNNSLNQIIEKQKQTIELDNNSIQQLQQNISENNTTISELTNSNNNLNQTIKEQKQTIELDNNSIQDLQQKNSENNSAIKQNLAIIQELNDKLNKYQNDLNNANEIIVNNNNTIENLRIQNQAILNSRSWKITRPIRFFGTLLRKIFRKNK